MPNNEVFNTIYYTSSQKAQLLLLKMLCIEMIEIRSSLELLCAAYSRDFCLSKYTNRSNGYLGISKTVFDYFRRSKGHFVSRIFSEGSLDHIQHNPLLPFLFYLQHYYCNVSLTGLK